MSTWRTSLILLTLVCILAIASFCFSVEPLQAAISESPSVTYPSNGAYVEPGSVTIRWNPVAGASSYGIGVVDDTIGVKIVNVDFGITGTSYTISSLLIKAGHSYRYSVGAIADDGTQKWVENLTFRVKNPTLTAPIITYPSNGAFVEPGSVTIRWTGVSGATTYLLAFKDLTSGMKYLDDQDVGNRTSYTISTGLITPGHSYKIALCAKNDSEEKWTESTFSIKEIAVKSLTPPVIYSPRNGETLDDPGSVTVRWSSVDGATKYLIAVMDITDGDKFVNDQDIGTSTNYTIPSYRIKPGHKYKIAVCAQNEREEKWTEATFSIKASEDTTPPRISGFSGRLEVEQGQSIRLPGSITSDTEITKVTLGVWGYRDDYASKYPNSKTFSMSSFVINTSSGLFSQPGEYVLTVWASSVGCPNPPSELGRMTLIVREAQLSGPQAPPVIISPRNGTTYDKGDIAIRWTSVSGATHYVVAVRDVTSEQKIVDDENVGSSTSFILRGWQLVEGHQYKIGVGAIGDGVEKWNTDTYITIRQAAIIDSAPPSISGLRTVEVEQGQSVSLPGSITSSTNITKVTLGVWGYQDDYASRYPNSKTFSMSSFVINTSSGLFSQPGEYVLIVWASSVGCPNPQRELGRMTLVVREPKRESKVLLAKPVIKYPKNGETLKKDDLTVRWDSVPGAASYGIGVLDITTDEKIVDIGNGWKQNSYTIPSAKLEEGHSYEIAVGAIAADGKTENWNDEGIRVTIAKPEVPVLTGFPAADQVIAGDKYTFKGRITCKSKLTKVTINLRGQSGDLWSRPISTDTFDLSSVTVDTSQGILAYPGTYTVNVWAATADWQPTEPLKSMTLTVKAPSPPALKGFPANQTRTITLGDTYSFEGYLTADCPITRVNAVVIGANTLSGIKEIAEELQGSIKTYNLNRLKIDTKLPEFSAAKRYEIRLWAKTERFQNPEVPLAIMWLEVKLGDAPQIENLPNSVDVLKGETYKIRGRVVSQSDLTKVTAIMKPKDHAGALGTFAPKIFTEEMKENQKAFDLSKFEIDTRSLPSGAYTIDIYAKSIANNVAEAPLGTMVLNVRRVLPPTIKDFEQYKRITVGEEYTLKGIITSTSTLTKVTAQIAGDASSVQSRDNLNTKNYSLNTFTFKPDKPGIYLVEVWAATKYLGKPTEPIGQMILDVRPENELLGPNNNVNGYKVFGFPLNKRIELFTGETYCFQGMLYSETPLYLVNLKISGPRGNGIDNDAFRQDVKGNVFDFRKYQFAALDRFAVPGDYKINLWVSAEGKQPEMLGSCTITVKSPTKWIDGPRYLDERDEVYVSLEVDEGIKKNGTYPIIAVTVFDGDERIGYYTLNQVKDNHFERYIPATELRRSSGQARTLRFNIMVDGYDPWYAKVNPNPEHVKTLTVPEAKWRIPVGGQQFIASATSDYLVVNVPTNQKLPSSFKVCMGVSADNKTWTEYPIPAKGDTYFSHSYRLGDLGLQRGNSYYFRATIYGPNNVVIDQTACEQKLIPTKPSKDGGDNKNNDAKNEITRNTMLKSGQTFIGPVVKPKTDFGKIVIPDKYLYDLPQAKGVAIPIYVPLCEGFDSSNVNYQKDGWTTVKRISLSKLTFSLRDFVSGFMQNAEEPKEASSKKSQMQLDKMHIAMQMVDGLNNSVSRTSVEIEIQKSSSNQLRAIIKLGDLKGESLWRTWAGTSHYFIAFRDDIDTVMSAARYVSLIREFQLPNDRSWDLQLSIDPAHRDDTYIGYLSYSTDGELICTPRLYAGDKLQLVYWKYPWRLVWVQEPVVESGVYLRYLLEQPYYLPKEDSSNVIKTLGGIQFLH